MLGFYVLWVLALAWLAIILWPSPYPLRAIAVRRLRESFYPLRMSERFSGVRGRLARVKDVDW